MIPFGLLENWGPENTSEPPSEAARPPIHHAAGPQKLPVWKACRASSPSGKSLTGANLTGFREKGNHGFHKTMGFLSMQ